MTAARKKALLTFVRSGKGLAGIRAASDSYHQASDGPEIGGMIASGLLAKADKNEDKTFDAAELSLADKWLNMADANQEGKVSVQDFKAGFGRILLSTRGPRRLHWVYPQHIVYKIDDPNSPLTAMFKNGFAINDETYTFGAKSWSRENVHVLTSID